MRCIYCGLNESKKAGKRYTLKGPVQRYQCYRCGHKFSFANMIMNHKDRTSHDKVTGRTIWSLYKLHGMPIDVMLQGHFKEWNENNLL